ncbi:hypothetical protein PGTUg99_028972 [Puccinia graminis f. sp. tritici]|uniref:BED-type domain-containing protein n=1 Tax=Puccinia graminis f. sp. tritici TaxID=56615 RepID=A0A5B0NHF3_PUCGR|nr:hypothetical protein PGTUg99_028972 [Puccinia graminis f. sp. tritici]
MSSTRKRPKASRISSASSTYPTENLTETNPSNPNESAATDAEEDLTTPASTQHQTDMSHEASDIQELKRARRVAANALSSSYQSYLLPELSDQRDKHGRRMICYPCKICGSRINRPTSDSSCSNLNKHAATCLRKQNESKNHRSLAGLGIKGTGDINPQEASHTDSVQI